MPWMVIGAGSEEVTLQAGWAQPCQPPCAVLSYFGRGVTPCLESSCGWGGHRAPLAETWCPGPRAPGATVTP